MNPICFDLINLNKGIPVEAQNFYSSYTYIVSYFSYTFYNMWKTFGSRGAADCYSFSKALYETPAITRDRRSIMPGSFIALV